MVDGDDDGRSTNAILNWLGEQSDTQKGSAIARQLADDPLTFLQRYLHLLPMHLLMLVGQRTSRRQRGTLTVIRDRRRRFAETVRPEELSVEEGRRRNPLLYKDVTGGGRPRQSATLTSIGGAFGASNSTQAADELANPEQVLSRPRFSALVQHFDEQDVAAKLHRQEEHRAETTAEAESEEEDEGAGTAQIDDGDDRADIHDESHSAEAEFGRLMLAQFIRGDNYDFSDELYRCDYDELWDRDTHFHTGPQRGVVRAMNSEERWFDEEEPN